MWKYSSLAFTCKATNWQPTPSVLLMCSEALCKLVNINIEFYILFSQFEIHACYCLQHSILTVKTNPGHIPSMKLPFFFFLRYMHFYFVYSFGPPVQYVELPRPRIEPTTPPMEAQSLIHWITREVPWNYFWWAFRFTIYSQMSYSWKLTLIVLKYGHCFSYSFWLSLINRLK